MRRDLEEFAQLPGEPGRGDRQRIYAGDQESLWQELADITDKHSWSGVKSFRDLIITAYHSGEVVGLGNLVCEKCHHHIAVYTPEVLSLCRSAGHDQFSVGRLSLNKSKTVCALSCGRGPGRGHQAQR